MNLIIQIFKFIYIYIHAHTKKDTRIHLPAMYCDYFIER